jgi:hypothetical protein
VVVCGTGGTLINSQFSILNFELSTRGRGSLILNSQFSILNYRRAGTAGVLGCGTRGLARAAGIQNAELELGGSRVGHRNAELELGGSRVGHRNAELELGGSRVGGPRIDGSRVWQKKEAFYNSFHARGEIMY